MTIILSLITILVIVLSWKNNSNKKNLIKALNLKLVNSSIKIKELNNKYSEKCLTVDNLLKTIDSKNKLLTKKDNELKKIKGTNLVEEKEIKSPPKRRAPRKKVTKPTPKKQ